MACVCFRRSSWLISAGGSVGGYVLKCVRVKSCCRLILDCEASDSGLLQNICDLSQIGSVKWCETVLLCMRVSLLDG